MVDNGSTDGSAEAVEREYPDVRVVRLDKNYGCPGGRNRTIPHARGDFLFFADNDGLLHCQAVERAVRVMLSDERIGVVAGRVKLYSDVEEVDTECDVGGEDAGHFSCGFSGGISLHRKVMYETVGVYPDDYMYSGEEEHLMYRMLSSKYLIYMEPTVILWHEKTDEARRKREESVLARANVLATNAEFWPIELFCLYAIRSLVVDTFRVAQDGYLWFYLRKLPSIWGRAVRILFCSRNPVPRQTMQVIWKLRRETVREADAVTNVELAYWKSLLGYLLWVIRGHG